ncbi:hypothetical protein [Microbulbifer agarilyticus]|uniref:hypothetical protein n=1 Tax=Microbulbifer agarilyticus TaxID=260552 RepID=UPI001CD52779|nr:hypothetical protein [Microbulbifer agarilyticus]MCA0899544.1 hypothetical protein [Microbulbifer agarilyticus]
MHLQSEFETGFKEEVSNRTYAHLVTKKLLSRTSSSEMGIFWRAYHQLEEFQAPLYSNICKRWGIDKSVGLSQKIKSSLIACAPRFLFSGMLVSTKKATEEYVDTLKSLAKIGPKSDKWFLDYMVAQESLQVHMLNLAIEKRYTEASAEVSTFIKEHQFLIEASDEY